MAKGKGGGKGKQPVATGWKTAKKGGNKAVSKGTATMRVGKHVT